MDEKWYKVAALDLKSVRQKFAFKKGWWWRTRHDAKLIEREYRQFLYLIICNPGQTVVPWSHDLDDFWHQHILDTEKYAQDCNAIMGSFIHHNPNLPEGSSPHTEAFAATRVMYKTAFSDSLRKPKRTAVDIGCGSQMQVVFCKSRTSTGHHHFGGGHHGGAHHAGGHDAGAHGGHGCGAHSAGHGCGGHGCGGHGGGH
jgi:hypothetical protein